LKNVGSSKNFEFNFIVYRLRIDVFCLAQNACLIKTSLLAVAIIFNVRVSACWYSQKQKKYRKFLPASILAYKGKIVKT